MEYHSTLTPELNSTGSYIDDVSDHQEDLPQSFQLVFTVLGIAIGITGIGFNAALLVLAIMKSPSSLSLKTRNLITSLASADLFLLLFGLPYELVSANNYLWLEGRIGCQMSAFLPEASRFVWMGTVVLSLPDQWPSLMKMRKFAPWWTALVWAISVAISIPFAVYNDCVGLVDYLPETLVGDQQQDGACICMLTVGQDKVVQMFGSSLVAFSVIPILAVARVGWKNRSATTDDDQTVNLKRNTSSKTLAAMLFIFMGCTLPRYIYIVVVNLEPPSTTDGNYQWIREAIEILCFCLFYLTSLIHMAVSPHPRSLLRRLVHRRQLFDLNPSTSQSTT